VLLPPFLGQGCRLRYATVAAARVKHSSMAPLSAGWSGSGHPVVFRQMTGFRSGHRPSSAVREDGDRLGEVGGRIVAEVLLTIIRRDPESYLDLQPAWSPTLPAAGPSFRLTDILVPG
jgi:hypothetical protein